MALPRKKTMVCVTVQKTCERLIREGAMLGTEDGLRVVHVVKTGGAVLGADSDGEALDYLYRIASEYGAEMDMLRSDDVAGTITRFAKENGISYIVMGAPAESGGKSIVRQLQAKLPGVQIFTIS